MSGMDGRPIVVGVDDSSMAKAAARWAAGQAERHKVELRLVHAINVSGLTFAGGYTPPSAFFKSIEDTAREHLGAVRDELAQAHPNLPVQVGLRSDHPVTVLIDESRSAGLVVVGAPAQNAVHDLLGGDISVSVAAHTHCPTAVIRADGKVSAGAKVVVGIDGSPTSEAAVAIAFDEAALRRAELVAVHGWNDYASDSQYAYAVQSIADWSAIAAEERETLAERLAGWQEKYPDVVVHKVVVREKAVPLLLAQSQGAQLLVVGSRGRGGFTGMLLGSVSQRLIHHASCPLIVARADWSISGDTGPER